MKVPLYETFGFNDFFPIWLLFMSHSIHTIKLSSTWVSVSPLKQRLQTRHDYRRDLKPDGCGRPASPGRPRLPTQPVDGTHPRGGGPLLPVAGTRALGTGRARGDVDSHASQCLCGTAGTSAADQTTQTKRRENQTHQRGPQWH